MYRELVPHAALRPFVDRLWISASAPDARPRPRRVLPDGCIDLLIDLADGGRAFVVGTMTRAVEVAQDRATRIVAVRFRPGGGAPFLRVRADELTDRQVAREELGLRWCAGVEDAPLPLAARRLEQALLGELPRVAPPDPLVAHAVRVTFGPAPLAVDALARRIGWSRQHLRRAFAAHVGVGPKALARVARLQRALARLQVQGGLPLARAAAELGYFDEAHMARDFRALAGLTPGAAQAAAGSIFPIPSLLEAA
jgi:AraC-like DNA-binding protein